MPGLRLLLERARQCPPFIVGVVGLAIFIATRITHGLYNAQGVCGGLNSISDLLIYAIVIPILPQMLEGIVDDVSFSSGILTGCFAGWLSDRYRSRQWPMCVGLGCLLVATVLFMVSRAFWQLVLARIAQGFAGGTTYSIGLSMVADVYPPHRVGMVMGIVMSCNTLGQVAGPAVGGWLYEAGGHYAPFILGSSLIVVDFVGRLVVGETAGWKERHGHKVFGVERPDVTDSADKASLSLTVLTPPLSSNPPALSLSQLATLWSVVAALGAYFAVTAILSGVDVALPIYGDTVQNLSPGVIGLLFVALLLPNAAIAPLVGWLIDRYQPSRLFVVCLGLLLMAAACPLAVITPSLALLIPMLMVLGVGAAIVSTPLTAEISASVGEHNSQHFGAIYGLMLMVASVAMFAGPIVVGALLASHPMLDTMFFLMAIALFPAMGIFGVEVYRARRKPSYYLWRGRISNSSAVNVAPLGNAHVA
ncbi:hypothetical protein H4R34_000963 [Dimargaris verticillata]|uniref:Major facilitator superfamily (MFS) profile domain-containing protein n=1 Tax=Dimargaris verticillata TaxID=2761393 RepID=A0A9W8BBN4_9FUNG|nr:hypothetical protein H4R34_000963 [Dimargaris verticillata]